MSLQNGIHVFFAGTTHSSVELFWVLIDETGRYRHERAYLEQLPKLISGPSVCVGKDKIHIVCTCEGYEVHEVTFDGTEFSYVGQVPNVKSADQTGVTYQFGATNLFYQNFNALEMVSRTDGGTWSGPLKLIDSNVYYGIGATIYNAKTVIAYCGSNSTLIVAQVNTDQTTTTLADSGATLQQTAALTAAKDGLYVLHASQDSSNSLYYRHYSPESDHWGTDTRIVNAFSVGGGPAAVYIDGNVISLTQGSGNALQFQARIFHEWIEGSATVQIDGNPVNNVWYSPAAVAVTAS